MDVPREAPMSPRKDARGSAERTRTPRGFTEEEREAMKERARELRAGKAELERTMLEKIAEMPEPDRAMAERIHALVTAAAPELSPRTWYGMPAWAKGGKVVCFFQNARKFKTRYSTFGFTDAATLDDGPMWPVSFALTELTPAVEARIEALVKRAVG
jgi:uncharacterized protein YdhG (YjbR/CyaY superfamily)